MDDEEKSERERDLDVARMQLAEARESLDDGDYVGVIDAMGSVVTWIAKPTTQDEPVASVRIEREGNAQDTWTCVYAGEATEIEIHGKATVRVKGEEIGLHGRLDDDR